MPVYFDSTTDIIGATSGAPISFNAETFTMCGFARLEGALGAVDQPIALWSDSTSYTSVLLYYRVAGIDAMRLRTDNGAGGAASSDFGSRPAVGDTFFWFIRANGTGANGITAGWCALDGSAFTTVSVTLATGADGAAAFLGFGGAVSSYSNMQMFGVRAWAAAVTDAELELERYSVFPVRLANIHGIWPLWDAATSLTDFSGNGNTLDNVSGFGGTAPSDSAQGFPVRIRSRRTGRLIAVPSGVLLAQSRYRFRNDDGSESAATWAAAENTTVSIGKNIPKRLRVQVQATNDPASAAYGLQFRKTGDPTWQDLIPYG